MYRLRRHHPPRQAASLILHRVVLVEPRQRDIDATGDSQARMINIERSVASSNEPNSTPPKDPLGHHRVIVVVVVQVVARLVVVDQLHHRAHPRQAHHQAVIRIVVIQVAPRKNCSKG